jgi:AraC-like DNA-binding protein
MANSETLSPAIQDGTQKPGFMSPQHFSADMVPVTEQFEFWNDRCSDVVGLKDVLDALEGFHPANVLWSIGNMALSHVIVPASATFRTGGEVRRDDGEHWLIGFLMKGSMCHRVGEAAFTVLPGQMFHFSLAEAFEGERTDCEWLTLFIPRDVLRDLAPALNRTRNAPIETPLSILFRDYLLSLERRLPSMTGADVAAVQEATHAMIAACIGHGGAAAEHPVAQLDDMRLGRIRKIIDTNLKSPTLGPKKLCRLAGISRSHLYRLFEPSGGVARYIQSQRLAEIYAALSDPEKRQSIASIAEEFGFTDASTFGRAFRAEFGCRPSDVRAAGLCGRVLRSTGHRPAVRRADDMGEMLRHLLI